MISRGRNRLNGTKGDKLRINKINLLRSAAAFVLAFVVIAGSIIAHQALQTQRKAEHLLAEVRALKLGDSNLDKVYQLVERYNGRVSDRDQCKTSNCSVAFMITNDSLTRYRFAPWTGFAVGIDINQGRTAALDLEMWSAARDISYYHHLLVTGQHSDFGCVAMVGEVSKYSDHYRPWMESIVKRGLMKGEIKDSIWVRLMPAANAAIRDKAMQINLDCLSRLGGCREARDFLPALGPEDDRQINTP